MATQLLLEILSTSDSDALYRSVAGIESAEWKRLVDEAVFHEVEAVLHSRLSALPTLQLPVPVRRFLHDRYAVHSLRNQLLYQELATILTAFNAANIPVIVLKGAYLAACVYGDPALRSMGDIDVMVRESDLDTARNALQQLGYAPGMSVHQHHLPAMRKPGATMVEIHWTIEAPSSPIAIDLEGLWERAQPVEIARQSAFALSLPDVVNHLCVHVAYHHKFGIHNPKGLAIKQLYDIAALVSRMGTQLDWREVQRTAIQWRAHRYVYCTLALSERLLGADIPSHVLADLPHDDADQHIVDIVAHSFIDRPSIDAHGFRKIFRQKGLLDRLRYASRTLFPRHQEIAALQGSRPGSGRTYLNSMLRPFQLLVRFVRAAAHLTPGTQRARTAGAREDARRDIDLWLRAR